MDTTLVLTGEQGALKSTLVSELFGAEFTRSQMPDLANKDASAALRGFWAIELAELDRIVRTETSTVKEFLTRTSDDYRPPYGRLDQHFPRECVFIGTCNDEDFLRDSTGNRRFWPIKVNRIDLEYLRLNRDAIWGQAAALETAHAQHWLDEAGDQKANDARGVHIVHDPWHNKISTYLQGRELVTTEEIYRCVLSGDIISFGRSEQMRISDTLKRLGCKAKTVTEKSGRQQRAWLVPGALASTPQRVTPCNLVQPLN
jgi:predicted P-loop ATPase